MSKYKITKYIPGQPIDISKPQEEEDPRERLTNLALISLRRTNLGYSNNYIYLKELITQFNERMKNKPTKNIVNVINIWLRDSN